MAKKTKIASVSVSGAESAATPAPETQIEVIGDSTEIIADLMATDLSQSTDAVVTDQADADVTETASAETPAPNDPSEAIGEPAGSATNVPDPDAPRVQDAAGTDHAALTQTAADTAALLDVERAEFRAKFPRLTAAIEAWTASSSAPPKALRVVAKVDGFRRAGMAHPSAATEHPLETFPYPEPLEALFAEPQLTVDFV